MDTVEAGRKGGNITAKRGPKFYRELQKKSVAARKKDLLSQFRVEDLDNPVLVKTLSEKLEQFDNE